jgi:ABC-2 type transport system ATP-binding protein
VRLGESEQTTRNKRELRELQRTLGFLPQGLQIFSGYTCVEFLRYVAWLRKVPLQEVSANIDSALRATDMLDQRNVQVRRLSGGMKQRLGLAQALVNRPATIVLDEPTVGLDPRQRHELRELMLAAQSHALVILATHLVEDVAAVCEDVVVLHNGRAVFAGPTSELAAIGGGATTGEAIEAGYLHVTARG